MHHFIILLKEDLQAVSQMSEEQLQDDIRQYTQWVEELSKGGHFVAGEPLETRGWQLKKDEVITNGPFIESKEAISGYFILKAESDEQAQALAKTCPVFRSGGFLELRPIMQF
jgi:hypothetical protein